MLVDASLVGDCDKFLCLLYFYSVTIKIWYGIDCMFRKLDVTSSVSCFMHVMWTRSLTVMTYSREGKITQCN